jgi:elongation factor G
VGEVPRSLIEIAIEPAANARSRLLAALTQLATADRAFGFSYDAETGQTILKCVDEVQLAAKVERLQRDFGLSFDVGAPRVAYRERLTRVVEIDCTHKKQAGSTSEFARVRLRFEPLLEDSDLVFTNGDADLSVPLEYISSIERGIEATSQNGVLAGFPLIEFKATLIGGAYHEIDSNALAFEIATRAAFLELKRQGAVELVEPVMDIEVNVPAALTDAVMNSLRKRRMRNMQRLESGGRETLQAIVPLASLIGYREALREWSNGSATFAMTFRAYEPVPSGPSDDPLSPLSVALKA